MRASSTQKTYDEAFLACSTAVYFESKNNEPEALRSWKTALDHIYYHNAHRAPTNSRPASETDKALHESLHQLELQCKERVDLLEALRRSREETNDAVSSSTNDAPANPTMPPNPANPANPTNPAKASESSSWLGGGTVRPVGYTDLSRPPLPFRPSLQSRKSSGSAPSLSPSPAARNEDSRTPSPEKRGRMLRTLRPGGKDAKPTNKLPNSMRSRPPEAAKAATQAWEFTTGPSTTKPARSSIDRHASGQDADRPSAQSSVKPYLASDPSTSSRSQFFSRKDLPPPPQKASLDTARILSSQGVNSATLSYRNEYPVAAPDARFLAASAAAQSYTNLDSGKPANNSARRPAQPPPQQLSSVDNQHGRPHKKESPEMIALGDTENKLRARPPHRRKGKAAANAAQPQRRTTSASDAEGSEGSEDESDEWKERVRDILKNLPRGVDKSAAQQILNEIVIQGDKVHWDDVAGLDIAKSALKETVVYPFLRPDLFMGLREPARGMLLFGPPGTGKTMLARAVATESKSTFFAISASSLTSKFLGESEKLVRALFSLAKMLAPSIIFVDEIDSLLSARSGSGEHEATRRIKTEFLIQWSDLAKAAAGREQTDRDKERGDASRVLVLAATNLPWAIDEAARRRFVRRQYIPLPEDHVRRTQVKTLLSHQKHELDEPDLDRLVWLTDGFSGSDITALAKDAAMGPLRSLGEKLLHMTMDEIRPIHFADFEASLQTIRPSVSKQGLKQYEDWAREFGERGG